MHCEWKEEWRTSWTGVGPYLVVTLILEDDECADASAVASVIAMATSFIPYAGPFVAAQLEANATQIITKNEGFGVIVVVNMPTGAVGLATTTVTSRKPADAIYSFTGKFSDLRVGVYDEGQSGDYMDDGWCRMLVDLNMGAGGEYIYFEVLPGDCDPISEVAIQHGGSAALSPPSNHVQVNTDLNKGAGGEYIYVSYTKGGTPLDGLLVYAAVDAYSTAPQGWTRIDVDLNKGAGGKYIYLCYKISAIQAPSDGTVGKVFVGRVKPGLVKVKLTTRLSEPKKIPKKFIKGGR
jgi:hypothetical protein